MSRVLELRHSELKHLPKLMKNLKLYANAECWGLTIKSFLYTVLYESQSFYLRGGEEQC